MVTPRLGRRCPRDVIGAVSQLAVSYIAGGGQAGQVNAESGCRQGMDGLEEHTPTGWEEALQAEVLRGYPGPGIGGEIGGDQGEKVG